MYQKQEVQLKILHSAREQRGGDLQRGLMLRDDWRLFSERRRKRTYERIDKLDTLHLEFQQRPLPEWFTSSNPNLKTIGDILQRDKKSIDVVCSICKRNEDTLTEVQKVAEDGATIVISAARDILAVDDYSQFRSNLDKQRDMIEKLKNSIEEAKMTKHSWQTLKRNIPSNIISQQHSVLKDLATVEGNSINDSRFLAECTYSVHCYTIEALKVLIAYRTGPWAEWVAKMAKWTTFRNDQNKRIKNHIDPYLYYPETIKRCEDEVRRRNSFTTYVERCKKRVDTMRKKEERMREAFLKTFYDYRKWIPFELFPSLDTFPTLYLQYTPEDLPPVPGEDSQTSQVLSPYLNTSSAPPLLIPPSLSQEGRILVEQENQLLKAEIERMRRDMARTKEQIQHVVQRSPSLPRNGYSTAGNKEGNPYADRIKDLEAILTNMNTRLEQSVSESKSLKERLQKETQAKNEALRALYEASKEVEALKCNTNPSSTKEEVEVLQQELSVAKEEIMRVREEKTQVQEKLEKEVERFENILSLLMAEKDRMEEKMKQALELVEEERTKILSESTLQVKTLSQQLQHANEKLEESHVLFSAEKDERERQVKLMSWSIEEAESRLEDLREDNLSKIKELEEARVLELLSMDKLQKSNESLLASLSLCQTELEKEKALSKDLSVLSEKNVKIEDELRKQKEMLRQCEEESKSKAKEGIDQLRKVMKETELHRDEEEKRIRDELNCALEKVQKQNDLVKKLESEKEQFKKKAEEVLNRLEISKEELSKKTVEHDRLQFEKENSSRKAQQEFQLLTKQKDASIQKTAEYSTRLERTEQILREKEANLEQLEKDNKLSKTKLALLTEELTKSENRVKLLETERRQHKQKLESLKQEKLCRVLLDAEIARLNQDQQKVNEELERSKAALNKAQKDKEQVESRVLEESTLVSEEMRRLEKAMASMRIEVEDHRQNAKKLETTIENNFSASTLVEQEKKKLLRELEEWKNKLKQLTAEYNIEKEELVRKCSQEALSASLLVEEIKQRLEKEIQSCKSKTQEMERAKISAEKAKQASDKECKRLAATIEEITRSWEKEKRDREEDYSRYFSESTLALAKTQLLEQDLQRMREEERSLREELDRTNQSLEKEKLEWQQRVEESLTKSSVAAQQRIKELQEKSDQLNKLATEKHELMEELERAKSEGLRMKRRLSDKGEEKWKGMAFQEMNKCAEERREWTAKENKYLQQVETLEQELKYFLVSSSEAEERQEEKRRRKKKKKRNRESAERREKEEKETNAKVAEERDRYLAELKQMQTSLYEFATQITSGKINPEQYTGCKTLRDVLIYTQNNMLNVGDTDLSVLPKTVLTCYDPTYKSHKVIFLGNQGNTPLVLASNSTPQDPAVMKGELVFIEECVGDDSAPHCVPKGQPYRLAYVNYPSK